MAFLGALFERLPGEARGNAKTTRFLGFQGSLPGKGHFEFFGIELRPMDRLPEGLVVWELDDACLTLRDARQSGGEIVTRTPIRWDWLAAPSAGACAWTGEISTDGGSETWPSRLALTTNSYVALDGRERASDEVVIGEYDPSWPRRYEEFAAWLRSILPPEAAPRIEHYGSTSIPGMPAKPIIDVLVEVPSFEAGKRDLIPRLNDPRWEYWWYNDHLTFIRRDALMGQRTHHLHAAPAGHRLWDGTLFRDFLRSHEAEALRYAELKRELARTQGGDRERYTAAKADFVQDIVNQAKEGRGRHAP